MDYRFSSVDSKGVGLPFKRARSGFDSSSTMMRDKLALEGRLLHISDANFVLGDAINGPIFLNNICDNGSRMAQMQDVVARQLVRAPSHDLSFNLHGPPLIMQRGGLCRAENPFTKEQYAELNHQKLIYKYIMEGVKPPPPLLFQLGSSVGPVNRVEVNQYRSSGVTLNWDGHNDTGISVDPEPGRCRRTDGKKWRCAREVVPDHKYCERHIHRGRQRSKKSANPIGVVATASTGAVVDEGSLVHSISNADPRSLLESDHPLSPSTSSSACVNQLPVQSTGLSGLGNKVISR